MIKVHRHYTLTNDKHLHAHVVVNPVGLFELEIVELNERHTTDFDNLLFESTKAGTKIRSKERTDPWQVFLANKDAREITHLIDEANEEYEDLMTNLG